MPLNQHIADLSQIIKLHGIRHVVICPGSRNAPLMQVFHRDSHFICHSIVDERSAGYIALGMARQLCEAVVVITTSGTAALNLTPAVAEAFFQQIPLVILTADRPPVWPPQFNNQIVNQKEIFIQNSKGFYNVPLEIAGGEELKRVQAEISKIVGSAGRGSKGPVHLNIPLVEPLYENLPEANRVEISPDTSNLVSDNEETEWLEPDKGTISDYLTGQKKVLVLAGLQLYSPEEVAVLKSLVATFNVVVIAENITNLSSDLFISEPDILLASLGKEDRQKLTPDLVIAFGGQVVSKRTRIFIQNLKNSPVNVLYDLPLVLFRDLIDGNEMVKENRFLFEWKRCEAVAANRVNMFVNKAEFCNMTAIGEILNAIPDQTVVHLGNSGTIRYSQLYPSRPELRYYANRGASGIDGSLSTAAGAAMVSEELHVIILGDLSFIYDSNSMWNKDFPDNLKIIVLNDGGGGIFRIIEGPDRMPFFEEFSVTHHPVSIQLLAEAFGLSYRLAKDFSDLQSNLALLFEKESGFSLLEVETSKSENSRIFTQFIKSIQEQ